MLNEIALEDDDHNNIDIMLSFYSSPFPALVGASKEEFPRRIEDLLKGLWGNNWSRTLKMICVHCRSFAELQAVARVLSSERDRRQ